MEFVYVMVDLIHDEVLFVSTDEKKLVQHLLNQVWFQEILEEFDNGTMIAEFGMNWKQEMQTNLYMFNVIFEDCAQIIRVPLV